ncbi:MAG: recombinase family protein [Clostridia bacterium]|nr:recombinase family protein [Clostridia bacterium]
MEYTPPLVSGNRLEQYTDVKETLDVKDINIGGYIRISTKKDSQKTSIENQKKYLKEWADVNGYNIIDFYIDSKSGAFEYLRNDMNRLKNDIATGKIKGIACKEISRTSRDILDIIELKRGLADKGAFFISVKEGYDSRTDDDEFLLIIHAGLAQKERKVTSSRVKITQLIKAKEGKTNVASPAFGYMLSNDRQHLVVNPQTAPIYHLIVEKFLEGWGQLKICKYLNDRGIRSKRGSKWNTNSIKTIVSNPVYLGVTIYNATLMVRDSSGHRKRLVRPREEWVIRENTHEPLITREKFDRLQAIVQQRRERDTKEWSCTKKYLLSGFLFCESCGSKLYGCKSPKKNSLGTPKRLRSLDDYYFYYTDRGLNGNCNSPVKNYYMDTVDRKVMDKIKDFFTNRDLVLEAIKNKQYLYDGKLESYKTERDQIKEKLESFQRAITKQQEAYEQSIINLDEYRQRMAELRELRQEYQKKLQQLNARLEQADSLEERYNSIKSKVLNYLDNLNDLPLDLKEEIVRKVVKRVYIKADYSLRFEYTFEE